MRPTSLLCLLLLGAGCAKIPTHNGSWQGYAREVKVYALNGKTTTALLFEPIRGITNLSPQILAEVAPVGGKFRLIQPAAYEGKRITVSGRVDDFTSCALDWRNTKEDFCWLDTNHVSEAPYRWSFSGSTNYVLRGDFYLLITKPKKIHILDP